MSTTMDETPGAGAPTEYLHPTLKLEIVNIEGTWLMLGCCVFVVQQGYFWCARRGVGGRRAGWRWGLSTTSI